MSAPATVSAGLEPIERASRDELQSLQLQRLRHTLQHAYDHVAHYRAAFDRQGVQPGDLRTLADLAKFPFTVKSDFRDNYPFGLLAVPREQCVRLHASSGTTGKPTVVGYTAADIDNWANLVARSIRAAGGRAGDIVHVAYGYGLFTGGLGAHYGAERLGCTVIPMSGGQTEKQVQLIRDLKPDIIMVHAVVHAGADRGVRAARASIRARPACASASSAPSRGPRQCGARSRPTPASTRSTSTGFRK
jgi:phenylacetate-CoA ligase